MSCEHPRQNVSLLLDGQLSPAEEANALAHLESCRSCNAEYAGVRNMREGLRKLNRPAAPAALIAKLRVLASHERDRQLRHVTVSTRLAYWGGRLRLAFDNMARPLALPFAGGLLSALLLYGSIMPRLAFQSQFHDDVPTMIFTDPDGKISDLTQDSTTWGRDLNKHYFSLTEVPRLEPVSSAPVSGDEMAVVLTIDPQGKVASWRGGHLTPELQSIILFSKFTPATLFGQPTWGKKQIVFRRPPAARS